MIEVAFPIEFRFRLHRAAPEDAVADDVLAAVFLIVGLGGGGFLGIDLAGPAFFLDGGLDGAVVIATEAGELLVDFAETIPALFGVLMFIEHGLGEVDKFGGEEGGEAVGEAFVAELIGEFAGVFDELGGEGEGLLLAEPVLIAALAPFGEVLFRDLGINEEVCQDGLGDAVLIEPFEDFGAGFAVFEADIDFFAGVFGEAGDFAGAGGVHFS